MAKPVQAAHTDPAASSTASEMLAANVNRVNAIIINDGTSDLYINIGSTAVKNKGIRVNANGGSYEISETNGNLDRRAISGVTVSATIEILVTEFA